MTSRDGTEGELNIFTESFPPSLIFFSRGEVYEVIDRARIASITNDVPCVFFHLHLKWLDEPFSERRRFERVGSILRNRFILAPFFTSRAMTGSVSDSRYSQRISELGARLAVTNSPILTFSVVKLQAKCESLLSLSLLSPSLIFGFKSPIFFLRSKPRSCNFKHKASIRIFSTPRRRDRFTLPFFVILDRKETRE